jgi:hypothetical protein
MTRAVYVGGFGNGQASADRVADALADYYDDVYPFTFSTAMRSPEQVIAAARGVDTYTHSAGMLAIVNASPRRIESFSPPLPTPQKRLLGRTAAKTMRMHTVGVGIQSEDDGEAVKGYDISSLAEFATHPMGNLRHLGRIAQFDAFVAAMRARYDETPVALTYTDGDEYYQLSTKEEADITQWGVVVNRIEGIHDELVIRPKATLAKAGVDLRVRG